MSDLDKIFSNMGANLAGLEARIDEAVQGAGISCAAKTKVRCPVDTGRLRSSYQHVKTGKCKCKIGTDVSYALPVETGHITKSGSHVAAKPHLFPSAIEAGRELVNELESIGVSGNVLRGE